MKPRKITLELDESDYVAIQGAIRHRLNSFMKDDDGSPILPDGDSDRWGAAIAEICRGWCELLKLPIEYPRKPEGGRNP